MKSLLLVAHGSRRAASNIAVTELAQQINNKPEHTFQFVKAAFLELAEPSIPDGIQACIDEGATEVLVLPYFLAAGRHVSQDIPELVQQAQANNPEIKIQISAYLGASEVMVDLVLNMAQGKQCEMCQNQEGCNYPQCVEGI